MADQIKELIEKINQEGVHSAQEKAREIETVALEKAEMIVAKANTQAKKIMEGAHDEVKRLQESTQAMLKQSARDLLLTLKLEIVALLERLIAAEVSSGLTPEELSRLIEVVIKDYCGQENKEIIIYLKDSDKIKLKGHFLNKLKDTLKKGVELRQKEDIHGGFIISFDGSKSNFDFSNEALAQYLGSCLKPKIAELFKDIK